MGYMTNQWLENYPERDRRHQLQQVDLTPRRVESSWPDVKGTLTGVSREKQKFQEV